MDVISDTVRDYAHRRSKELLAQDTYNPSQLITEIMNELERPVSQGVQNMINEGLATGDISLTPNLRMVINQ